MMEPTPYSNLAPNLNGRCNEETHENCNAENIGQKATQKIDPKYEILEIYQKKQHRKNNSKSAARKLGRNAHCRTLPKKKTIEQGVHAADNPSR